MAATLAAIDEADVITLGPGSLFTSVMPNLLVDGMAAAIRVRRRHGLLRQPDVATRRDH